MLVFTRKRNEAIIIGDGIEVRVLRVGKDGVRLGVTAPRQVAVHRQEVYELVSAANASAATAGLDLSDAANRLRRHLSLAPGPDAPS